MIAIIPARSGSKGLPGKNIKELNGDPLIAYTIKAAISCEEISRIIVSTDCSEIARVAISYGAEVPFLRPKELSTDESIAIDAYIYTLKRLEETESISFSDVIILQPTSPLRSTDNIKEAIRLYWSKSCKSLISMVESNHPPRWLLDLDKNMKILSTRLNSFKNRQEEPKKFIPNGAIFIVKKDLLMERKLYAIDSYAYVMSRRNSIDIDDMVDFKLAQVLMLNS